MEHKIKIAIISRKMIIGGVEKSLLSLLNRMRREDIKIDLYLESLNGDLFDEIPTGVNVIEIPKRIHFFKEPLRYINSINSKLKIRKELNYLNQCELTSHCLPKIEKIYDLAISYHAPNTIPVFYTINNIDASKKILWLHGDIITNNATCELVYNYYNEYDKIFGVSEYIKETLNKQFPKLYSKADVFYNFVDEENLKKLSYKGDSFNDNFDGTRILTIGRLDYQKGYDLAIKACHNLIEHGYNIKWYICGEGSSRKEIEDLIKKYNLRNDFILLGNQKNPYGYLKDCDIYVQTSRFEGYCTTTNEARILRKPVVTTNVSGANEQFENNKTGIIVDINENEIYKGIKILIENTQKRIEFSKNIELNLVNKVEDIDKLMCLL
ncbi:UDP-N-acetylglucosamine--peptide N-acetylglucosaminyltransferase GtfA subunit [Terrisporobacter petrolearius]|uniref:glycosyltransferase n=1 Tax=Terrisporobacter petrolearius TaxID=1460447 RepID=UPI00336792EC